MEHHKADVWQVAGHGAAGDDAARFLRELRQLRDGAGLGHAELAARAHYPYDTIKAAETGPTLPDLPVLSAFVRGCGGTAEEWEERWRRLTRTPSLPVSAARQAGDSAAATAGARIGAATEFVDAPDPSVIIAALSRVAEGMAVGNPASPADDSPAAYSPADVSFADVSLPEPEHLPFGDVPSGDVPSGGAYAPDPADSPTAGPADFSAPAPFAPAAQPDDPLVAPAGDPPAAPAADAPAGPAAPEAGAGPRGWDPIRVSAAWPAIGSEDPRTAAAASAASTPASSPASPSGTRARPGTRAPREGGTRPVVRQSAWARGADASGEPAGVARPGSRARTLMVAVVLACVIAVLLAIFA